MKRIENIGVFTSGGDAPGMNAAIRAVVRTGIWEGFEMFGIYRGYQGMIDGHIEPLYSHSVSNIIQRGGTILKTARSQQFMTQEGRALAYEQLVKFNINALIAIGGNGTFTGATELTKEYDIPVVGLPGTIDNDLYGTDYTIGFDTAINTAIAAADKIRDTATSHDRLFFIQVMGRDSGYIALWSGVACGAEFILVPETKTYIDNLTRLVKHDIRKNKTSGIVIVAERDDAGNAETIAAQVKERLPELETRVTILGHVQRGGSPTASDRMLASILGYASVKALKDGQKGVMVGMINKQVVFTPFEEAVKNRKGIILDLLEMSRVLAL